MASFRSMTGNKKSIAFLKRAILSDKVSHAWLFCGDTGSEKNILAQAFAQALQCSTLERLLHRPLPESDDAGMGGRGRISEETDPSPSLSPDAVDACGACPSCLQAESGSQPDLITWTHEKPKVFSVEDARRLVADVQIRPFGSARKVYIIPDAHLMNTEAQNTLLKTLEEPPEYAVLLLLSDSADRMLETIRSRCILLDLESSGQILSGEARELAMHILRNIRDLTHPEILENVRELAEYKPAIEDLLDLFDSWYRDILYFKATGDANGILHEDHVPEIRAASADISYEGLQRILSALETACGRLAANVNFDLTMELLLLTMREGGA